MAKLLPSVLLSDGVVGFSWGFGSAYDASMTQMWNALFCLAAADSKASTWLVRKGKAKFGVILRREMRKDLH